MLRAADARYVPPSYFVIAVLLRGNLCRRTKEIMSMMNRTLTSEIRARFISRIVMFEGL